MREQVAEICCHDSAPLYEASIAFAERVQAPFYCPGHKGGRTLPEKFRNNIAEIDLNNLPDTDTLHCPSGPIREAERLLADAYGVDRSFLLVGGSTTGNVAAILSTIGPGEEVLVQRNVHKSVIAGLVLAGAIPVWLPPVWDSDFELAHGLDAATVDQAFQTHPHARALVALNPTYYGTTPDIRAMAVICAQHDKLLLVDEAHGAHFHFHPELPLAAEDAGADLITQSTHKMLSGLSQAAVLHLHNARVDEHDVSKVLQLLQTTSPNFAIMASIDLARRQMALEGRARFGRVLEIAREGRRRLAAIPGLRLLAPPTKCLAGHGFFGLDETKILIHVGDLGLTGAEVQRLLNQRFGIQPELAGPGYLLCILTVGSIAEDVERLVLAMSTLAGQARSSQGKAGAAYASVGREAAGLTAHTPPMALPPREAFFARSVRVAFSAAKNRVCGEVVTPYPPGIPALVPGERITVEILDFLARAREAGCPISASDPSLETMRVVS